jgi:predicted DNA-binding transcriptional regulator AlpA
MSTEILPARSLTIKAPAETPPAILTMALIRKHFIPFGERTLHRMIAAGAFPRAEISFGGKIRCWRRETIEAWIDAQVASTAEAR